MTNLQACGFWKSFREIIRLLSNMLFHVKGVALVFPYFHFKLEPNFKW